MGILDDAEKGGMTALRGISFSPLRLLEVMATWTASRLLTLPPP